MENFDDTYLLLEGMYQDPHYPKFLVDRLKYPLIKFIEQIEKGNLNLQQVQEKLDDLTIEINNLQEDFHDHESDLEPLAKECLEQDIKYILDYFKLPITMHEALRHRNW